MTSKRALLVQMNAFIRKEFFHVFRDKKSLLLLFGLPVVQIVLFGFALTNEVKNSEIVVLDYAKDDASRAITNRIQASRYFEVRQSLAGPQELEGAFRKGEIKLALVFPAHFNEDLLHQHQAQIQILADGSDPNTASTLTNYLSNIIQDYQSGLSSPGPYTIQPEIRMLYNPQLKGAPNFVPGVMALVLLLICVMMTSISIVREKELGTMEILLVSPFQPILVILSKVVPYLLLSLVNLTVILLLSVFALDLPINGSIPLLFAMSALYIITSLCLGILISTITESQQAAMLISLMGMMLPTMLFTGFMFPIENMPLPLQMVSRIVPSRYYYIIVKSIMIKGLGFTAIWKEACTLLAMTVFLLVVSLKNFKTRLE